MDQYSVTIAGKKYSIPDYMRDSVEAYVKRGVPFGDFLTAVFSNDLVNSYGKADDINIRNIPAYVNFLYNFAPSACWGSKEKIKKWKGLLNKD